jgi:hypothetical protein
MQTKLNINEKSKRALLEATVVLQQVLNPSPSNGCEHPRQKVIGCFPRTTGGKEVCTCCKQVRTQFYKNGPWRPWQNA